MKKLVLTLILVSMLSYAQKPAKVKSGIRPDWGPVSSNYFRYYYLPDMDIYYDIGKNNFIYDKNGKWAVGQTLPQEFKKHNLYKGYKVILNDYDGELPYKDHKSHLARYPKQSNGKVSKTMQTQPGNLVQTKQQSAQSIPATKYPAKE